MVISNRVIIRSFSFKNQCDPQAQYYQLQYCVQQSVVAFGLVFGIAGIILATPLAVIAMVLVGMFYVQDVLGKVVKIPGQSEG